VAANVAVAEDGVSRYQEFGSGFHYIGYGFQIDPTVYFDTKIEFAFGAHAGQRSDLVQRIGNEFLAAETGVHAHDQDVVDEVEDLGESFYGGGGIDDDARFATVGGDEMERAIEMDAGFLMDGDPVSAGFGEFRNEEIGILDHKVTVEGNFELMAERTDNGRSNGEIGDEVTVHDVEM